ncbi:uncharacterized protein LOC108113485 [Drosophila eugracilis]|uniref:uncharacterized protein LOC108113485 n=1 Tax=Drosophila eugracilis TaxID=29029 RepID=UPI0007E77BEC|nr:uncharacterized protein LOC108113485 [Drosophila eugracilis]
MRVGFILQVQVIVALGALTSVHSKLELTNIKCISHDPDFAGFEYCLLKSINRSYKYLSLKVKLFKVPITDIKVNLALAKKSSGYNPFLYNITVDACRFLKYPKSNPVIGYMYDFFRAHSNMNHTCPYDHDLLVDKVTTNFINKHVTEVLPFPEGEFRFRSHWIAYGILRATASVYATLS